MFATLVSGFAAGCSSKPAPEGPPQATQDALSAGDQPSSPDTSTKNLPETQPVDLDRKETKWIGNIPYDVFYDRPLTIAADTGKIAGGNSTVAATTPTADSSTTMPSTSVTEEPSASARIDWAEILPMPTLINETKLLRNRLSENLQTVGTYNKSTSAIALDGAMMAALGAIATVHSDDDPWKPRAKFVRDLGYEIYMAAGGTGRTAFTATEEPFLKLLTTLDGGTVNDIEASDVVPFSDVVYAADIMKRIETATNDLKANVNTEARMKEDPERIEQELRVLAALGSIIGTEGYDSADAEPYQQLVNKFVAGALRSVQAVKAEDYAGFREGLTQIESTCTDCHQQYRSSSSSF